MNKIADLQAVLGVKADGMWGPQSRAALDSLVHNSDGFKTSEGIEVKASSFADPADVTAYRKCKAAGGSDHECFKVGDNGIGFTGLNCADDNVPMCALPPEEWKLKWGSVKNASGKPVDVTVEGKTVRGIMGDTMPEIRHITNGARIDLNPGFSKAFGLHAPFMVKATWRWA